MQVLDPSLRLCAGVRRACQLFSLLAALVLWLCAARAAFAADEAPTASSVSLLAGRAPLRSHRVHQPEVLTDGIAAYNGGEWKTNLTARFADALSYVDYDLGSSQPIDAAWLQGDNNDIYEISLSDDGNEFHLAWRAPTTPQAGTQERHVVGLRQSGRYVRISASGGDHALALSEVQIFSQPPAAFPQGIQRRSGVAVDRAFRDKTLVFGAILIFGMLGLRAGGKRWITWLGVGIMALAGLSWAAALKEAWHVSPFEVALVRGAIAVVAVVAIVRDGIVSRRHPSHPGVVLSVLGLCGVGAFMAFYNLGHPQFFDEGKQVWTFGHQLDLRQYYQTAKYYREVGYRGTYEADVAAFAEEEGVSLDQLSKLPMRDLHSFADSRVDKQRARIESARSKFSDERWAQYRADLRFFRDAMGKPDFLRGLSDFSGNATPVWMAIAHVLFNLIPPSNMAFALTGAIDTVLFIGMFIAIWRTFGLRAMLVCLVVFGANDFVNYGTNWGGATLRHDWLAYLGFGIAALRRERWFLAGALFGCSVMIRAFPLLALLGAALPSAWWLFDHVKRTRKLPPWREFVSNNAATLRIAAGAAAAMLLLFVFSISVLPASAWADWYSKVSQLEANPHPATLGLRTLFGGSNNDQQSILLARLPAYAGAIIGFIGLTWLAARGRKVECSAVLGLMLLPVVFTPAIYYLHLVCFFPLAVAWVRDEAPSAQLLRVRVWAIWVGLCIALYMTTPVLDFELHFRMANTYLMLTLGVVLLLLAYEQWRPREEPAAASET